MASMTDELSISRLLGHSVAELANLVRSEADLARAELSEKVFIVSAAAKLIAAGVVLLIPALVLILFAVAAGLMQLGLSAPVGYFCVGLGSAIIALLVLRAGFARLSANALRPVATFDQLKRDKVAAKELFR